MTFSAMLKRKFNLCVQCNLLKKIITTTSLEFLAPTKARKSFTLEQSILILILYRALTLTIYIIASFLFSNVERTLLHYSKTVQVMLSYYTVWLFPSKFKAHFLSLAHIAVYIFILYYAIAQHTSRMLRIVRRAERTLLRQSLFSFACVDSAA